MRQLGNYPLWIGNARDARDIRALLAARIHAVVDLAAEELPVAPNRELVYFRLPLIDGEGNDSKLLQATVIATSALVKARIPTLIACGMGMSRAPAVAAVALANVYHLAPNEVLKVVPGPGDVSPTLLRDLQTFVGDPA